MSLVPSLPLWTRTGTVVSGTYQPSWWVARWSSPPMLTDSARSTPGSAALPAASSVMVTPSRPGTLPSVATVTTAAAPCRCGSGTLTRGPLTVATTSGLIGRRPAHHEPDARHHRPTGSSTQQQDRNAVVPADRHQV